MKRRDELGTLVRLLMCREAAIRSAKAGSGDAPLSPAIKTLIQELV